MDGSRLSLRWRHQLKKYLQRHEAGLAALGASRDKASARIHWSLLVGAGSMVVGDTVT